MEKEIKEIIEKNLPEQVGKVLRERLEDLENTESDYKRIVKELDDLEKINKNLGDIVNAVRKNLEDITSTHKSFDDREKEISYRENNVDVHDAEKTAQHAENKVHMLENVLNTVFRSPVYKSTCVTDKKKEYASEYNSNTNQYEDKLTNEIKTETTTTEEDNSK